MRIICPRHAACKRRWREPPRLVFESWSAQRRGSRTSSSHEVTMPMAAAATRSHIALPTAAPATVETRSVAS